MDAFCGNWNLVKNENFDAFLQHCEYGWLQRQAALLSNIELGINVKEGHENTIERHVRSTFFNVDEDYIADGVSRTGEDGVTRTHSLNNGTLVSQVKGNMSWNEKISLDESGNMVVTRTWETGDGESHVSRQYFTRS